MIDGPSLMIVAGLIPLLTAVVTKLNTSARVKALVNLFLSAGLGVVQAAIDTGLDDVVATELATTIMITYAVSVASYYGLWKPTGVAPVVAAAAKPELGIGPVDRGGNPLPVDGD